MNPWLAVAILLVIAIPFLIMGALKSAIDSERKHANPPPATLPTTFRSDRALVLIHFLICCVAMPPSLYLIIGGIRNGAFNAGTPEFLLGLIPLVPSAWFFWRFGYRLIRPDTLTLSANGITCRTINGEQNWAWRDIAEADYQRFNGQDRGLIPPQLYLIQKSGGWETLGNLWSGPFGISAAPYLTKVICATLAAHSRQPINRNQG